MRDDENYVTIIYVDKRTLEKREVTMPCLHRERAMKIAKKLRPRYHKIEKVTFTEIFN